MKKLIFTILIFIALGYFANQVFGGGIGGDTADNLALKVSKDKIIDSQVFTETEYQKDAEGKILLDKDQNPMIESTKQVVAYSYKSDEIAPALDNEILEKRTENIVTRDLGNNRRSAQSGYNFYKEGTEWKQIKFATTTPEVFNKATPISWLINMVLASQTASTSPGTMADDATVGTVEWANPDNAKVSDNVYATTPSNTFGFHSDYKVQIVKADGSIGTTNKASGVAWDTTEAYFSYGSSSDLWGETWDDTKINDIDFGVVLSVQQNGIYSHYLKATNFGFSIPSGATINGILIEIERKDVNTFPTLIASVDHIRMTIYYTEGGGTTSTSADSGLILFE